MLIIILQTNRALAVYLLLGAALAATALATTAVADQPIDYARQIKPILKERCYACHGALKQESNLRLDSVAMALAGGDSGSALIPGNSRASRLVERIASTDESDRMPPDGKPLTLEQVDLLSRWIDSGAVAPQNEQVEEDPRRHWAFQKPVRSVFPGKPPADAGEHAQNPIDALIEYRRHDAGVQPLQPADKATLLRRLYLDLVGLPPTADEVLAFVLDDSPLAYEAVVERLLDSPQHGERWARHWMDVWRYSDWYGRRAVPDVMNSYPMVWRWRDWIVRSINDDKPYDEMIIEMLAADEVLPTDDRNLVATGYLVRSWFKWNYETWKKDLVEHTGKAFLGLTLNCAQCHDHKYDPITQKEYFRFRAFFEPLELRHDRVSGETDPGPFVKYVYGKPYGPISSGMVRVFDEYLNAETFMFAKGDARLRMEGKPAVSPGAPAVIGGDQLSVSSITLPLPSAYPGMKDFVRAEERAKRHTAISVAETQLAQAQSTWSMQPETLREELRAAESSLADARSEAIRLISDAVSNGADGAPLGLVLSGSQSLVLDAKAGRRALSHHLPGLDALADNGTVTYLVKIIQDGHTNLQLGLDIAQGATGGFVAFENGTIKTYSPGGFSEFVAAKYDLSKGENCFRVEMRLELAKDQFLLKVTLLADNRVLIDAMPAALNGWKPVANGKRGLFVDCRPGTAAVYDDLCFSQPDGSKLLLFDFESPDYAEGRDVTESVLTSAHSSRPAGSGTWAVTSFCQAPATSQITSAIGDNPSVLAAATRLSYARLALEIPMRKLASAEARLFAAQRELECLEKRMEADSLRYSTGLLAEDRLAEPEVNKIVRAASQCEREYNLAAAKSVLADAELAVATAEAQGSDAAKRSDQTAIDAAQKALQAAQQQRGNALNALRSAESNLSSETAEYTPLSPKYPQVTSGRRTILARWIASNENPLTARVAVNHIWLRHFGKALVESTHDFGRNGSRPTHPELLDWLACELMDSGWSMKHMHRLIVTSRTYQLASTLPRSGNSDLEKLAAASAADPDNKTYWRFPEARMQAEVVRDSLLAVAGQLDPTLGGHEIDHKQGMTSRRRSLYFAHHGEEKMEFLELFDAANACDCYRRTSSVQPQQALALTNSELTKSLSRHLAGQLWTRVVSEEVSPTSDRASRFVQLAFLQVLNREPRPQELSVSLTFLELQASRLSSGPVGSGQASETNVDYAERSRSNLIHALMNHNDFVTIR